MIFTLEYFNTDTFCSMDLCLYDNSRRCRLQKAYCSPIVLFEDEMQEELVDENYITLRETEKCRMNTWLWVVHSSDEGEAHFALENDILDAVSTQLNLLLYWFNCCRLNLMGR